MGISDRLRVLVHSAATEPLASRLRWIFVAAVALYAIGLTTSGIFLHRITSTHAFINGQDYHYAVAFGPALRLAFDPSASLEALRVNFGLLFTLTAAGLTKLFHISTFGGWLTLVQVFQFGFVACALCGVWFLERSRPLLLVVAAALAPRFSTLDQSVIAATSSGFRFFSFAVLPLALVFLLKTSGPFRLALHAGVATALLVLWNPETGIACSASLLFFVFVTQFIESGAFVRSLGVSCLTIALSVILLAVSYAAVLGGAASPHLLLEHFAGHFIAGYQGHPFGFSGVSTMVAAIACAIYASAVVIHCCLAVRAKTADRRSVARAAMAVAAIVWFGYFANFPDLSKLYTVIALLAFTLAPVIRDRRLWVPVTVWLLVGYLGVMQLVTTPARFGVGQPTFQGIILPRDAADYLTTQAAALRAVPAGTVYFASAPFSMALASRRTNALAIFDPFGEVWTIPSFQELMQSVSAQHPGCVLIETADSPLLAASPQRGRFLQRVQSALPPDYKRSRTDAGWDFWCRG